MKATKLSLDEVLQQLQSEVENPSSETARDWGRRFPVYRDEIADFVSEWMFQAGFHGEPAAFDQDLAHSRASGYLANAVHSLRSQSDVMPGLMLAAQQVGLDTKALAKVVRANTTFIQVLEKREIALESIPAPFLAALAAALQVSVRSIANWLVSGGADEHAPAFGIGEVPGDESEEGKSFEQAWRECGLSDEDLRHWLA